MVSQLSLGAKEPHARRISAAVAARGDDSRKIRHFAVVVSVVSKRMNFLKVEFVESTGCELEQVLFWSGDTKRKFFL
jgi:hypothetical protein